MRHLVSDSKFCFLFLFFLLAANLFCIFGFVPVFAEEFNRCGGVDTSIISCSEGGDGGIWHIVHLVVDILSIGVGILGVIGISVVGIQYLTAGPNTEKVTMTKRRLFQIIIGLAAYAVMFAFLQWLLPGGFFNNPADNISSITIDKPKATVGIGKSEKLSVQFEPAEVTDKTLSWKSANNNIASVINGVVVGKKTGKTKITATSANGKEATVEVTVKQPEPTKLDFSYKGNGTVEPGLFSSETMRIVEKHLYDVNAQNFYDVINSYGGFEKYAKSLGGVFGKYYGKTIKGRTEYDFQKAAEYVLGWMYMYGWDYKNGGGEHIKWGGSTYAPDAFYANGTLYDGYLDVTFDERISGKKGLQMSTECGGLPAFIFEKLGINNGAQKVIDKLRDLRPGDGLRFFRQSTSQQVANHVAIVGEVYDDRIVIYDAGRYFQNNKSFKRVIHRPQNDAEENVSVLDFPYWLGYRFADFKRS